MSIQTVLIADDEPHLIHIVAYNLTRAGLSVRTAANGEQCHAMAAASPPDLVITDFQMPVLDGLQAAIRMRDDPRTAAVPVLMLTARGHRVGPADLARTNIRGLIAKPFSARDLLDKIAALGAAEPLPAAAANGTATA